MIEIGSTIALEAWNMKYKPNTNLNHDWGASPVSIIPHRLWGIRPAESGFQRFLSSLRWLPGNGQKLNCLQFVKLLKQPTNRIFEGYRDRPLTFNDRLNILEFAS